MGSAGIAEKVGVLLADAGYATEAALTSLADNDPDRQWIIEPVFGQIKHVRSITTLARRGKEAAQDEWKLVTATHNLLKLFHQTQRTGVMPTSRTKMA